MTDTTAQTIKTGDILYSTWGYEQTNITYYYVVKATAKTVTVQEMNKEKRQDDENYCGVCVPKFILCGDEFKPSLRDEKPSRRKIHDFGGNTFVKMSSYEYAYPWDHKAKRYTDYA